MSGFRIKLLFACVTFACGGTSAALAGTIVVRSSGPSAKSYPPGKSLPAKGKLLLKTGDAITILDDGGTRVYNGPGSFPVGAGSGAATGSAFGQFLKNIGRTQDRSAATRGDPTLPQSLNPNIWFADIAKPGTHCIVDPASVYLWRAGSAKAAVLTLTGNGKTEKLSFAKGQSLLPWPVAALPVVDKGQYSLSIAGQPNPVKITIRTLPSAPTELADVAAALIKNGCATQVDLLVETVS